MTESSVSSAFMTALRVRLPDAVVVKHRDSSFIGLPDCSVTWNDHVLWLEFKLLKSGQTLFEAADKAPAQAKMMKRLARAGRAAYVGWRRGSSFVEVINVSESLCYQVPKNQLVDWAVERIS